MPHTLDWLTQLDATERPLLEDTLRRRAVRQVATLKASGAALAHAPTLDDRIGAVERAKEELSHLERASEMYRELCGQELLKQAEGEAAKLPVPTSWSEASVAQLVLCLAARVDLSGALSGHASLRQRIERELSEEAEHVNAARAALQELKAQAELNREPLEDCVARWLPVALSSLRDDAARKSYLTELRREASALGLRLPNVD